MLFCWRSQLPRRKRSHFAHGRAGFRRGTSPRRVTYTRRLVPTAALAPALRRNEHAVLVWRCHGGCGKRTDDGGDAGEKEGDGREPALPAHSSCNGSSRRHAHLRGFRHGHFPCRIDLTTVVSDFAPRVFPRGEAVHDMRVALSVAPERQSPRGLPVEASVERRLAWTKSHRFSCLLLSC